MNCYSGRGEFYQGNATVTDHDDVCAAGTFCRNPSPNSHKRPYCLTEQGHWRSCKIVRCDEVWGKYLGNRGFRMSAAPKRWIHAHDLEYSVSSAIFATVQWTNLDAHMHLGKYANGNNGYWNAYEDRTKDYTGRGRTTFVAPYDGVFKFIWRQDDYLRVLSDHDDETGEFELQAWGNANCGMFDKYCRLGNNYKQHSKRYSLKKGETVPIDARWMNGNGPGYANVGVQFLGLDGAGAHPMGTWHDKVEKEKFATESYIYHEQEIWLKKEYREDVTWIIANYDQDLVNSGTGLQGDEEFDDEGFRFRFKVCGDDNNCFTSTDLNAKSERPFEDDLKDQIKSWTENICQKKGSMNPIKYHAHYESSHTWPWHWHFEKGAGAWCGRKAHESHNHDIFHHGVHGGSFFTDDTNDLCFAHKGPIDRWQFYVKVHLEGDGQKEHNRWVTVDAGYPGFKWEWRCVEIEALVDKGLQESGVGTRRSDSKLKVYHIRPNNDDAVPVYIDELHIGKVRQSFEMERTQRQLAFDDQAVIDYDVDRYRYGNNGDAIRIRWLTNDSRSKCGWKSILPEILAPSGNEYTIDSSSDQQTGAIQADWANSSPPLVNVADPSLG